MCDCVVWGKVHNIMDGMGLYCNYVVILVGSVGWLDDVALHI